MSKWYNIVSSLDKNAEVLFMNFGYSSDDLNISLQPIHELNRYSIQLYHQIASKVELAGKNILEVGCGRGGGLDYIVENFSPLSAVGVDLSPRAISFCNQHYRDSGINFMVANAEKLPFADNSIDVVINVESSHIYGNMDIFLSEVKRILSPGGHLLITDFRRDFRIKDLMHTFSTSGLFKKHEENITSKVIDALEKDDHRKRKLVKKIAPKFLHNAAMHFAAVKGSKHFNDFVRGKFQYFNFVLQKSHHPPIK